MKLSSLEFFSRFPNELVRSLESIAQHRSLQKGTVLMKQGADNSSLYFLMKGELSVHVDGGLVARMSTPGDLIGEMSLISNAKSTATIIAATNCEIIQLDGYDMNELMNRSGQMAKYNLYKIYSDILVQKLESTNHRAKKLEAYTAKLQEAQEQLEATNASLEIKVQDRTRKLADSVEELKQKNAELQATYDKIKDLYQNRDLTFQSLESLLNKNLMPLKLSMDKAKAGASVSVQDLDLLQKEVNRAIHRLEPLANSFAAEKSMNSKKVLLAEPVKKQHTVAKLALGGTGVELEIVQTAEEAKAKLQTEKYDIFMFGKEFLNLTNLAKTKNPQIRFVFVTNEDIPDYVPTLLGEAIVPNVVSRDEEDRQFTIKNYTTTVSKLASGNYFGLEKYISWGVEVKEHEVSRSDQRSGLIESMDEYFANSGLRSSNRGRCSVVAEELLMNAIYDAPRDSEGNSLYNHKSRTEVVELKANHRSLFRYATDGNMMAVSIEDPFGGLDADTLFRYLEKCYAGGSLNDGRADKGGGGRGLHQIIENSDLVVFNIDPGKRTEVIALFNTDQKAAPHRNPNLHFFKVA